MATDTLFGLNTVVKKYVDAIGLDGRVSSADGARWSGVVVGGGDLADWLTANVGADSLRGVTEEEWKCLSDSFGVIIRSATHGIFAVECYKAESELFARWGEEAASGFLS